MDKELVDQFMEEHRNDQILRIYRNSTPATRHQWLLETIELLWRNGKLRNKIDDIEDDDYRELIRKLSDDAPRESCS